MQMIAARRRGFWTRALVAPLVVFVLACGDRAGTRDAAVQADATFGGTCDAANERGFFRECPGCPGGDCLGFSQQHETWFACRCSADTDCPCGASCGCFELAPSVPVCGVCVMDTSTP
jgi:hypothetical protein